MNASYELQPAAASPTTTTTSFQSTSSASISPRTSTELETSSTLPSSAAASSSSSSSKAPSRPPRAGSRSDACLTDAGENGGGSSNPAGTESKLGSSPTSTIATTPRPSKLSLELTFDGDDDEEGELVAGPLESVTDDDTAQGESMDEHRAAQLPGSATREATQPHPPRANGPEATGASADHTSEDALLSAGDSGGTLGRIMRSASITATLDDQRRRRAGSTLSERPSEENEHKWEALVARAKEEARERHDGDDGQAARTGKESNLTAELADAVESLLGSVRALSGENASLLAGRAELELNLKIARSNLQLAEMNSEMLEEALRRGGEGFAGRMLPPPSTTASTSQAPSRSATPIPGSTSTSSRSSLANTRDAAPPVAAAAATARSSLQQSRSPTSVPLSAGHASQASLPVNSLSSVLPTSAAQPKLGRRRSGSDGGSTSASSSAQPGAIAIPSPSRARPGMERSATLMPTSATSPTSASATSSSGFGSFFRNLTGDKPPSLGSLKMPDLPAGLRDLSAAIPSPSAETRKQFFDQFKFDYEDDRQLGMSHGGQLVASTPNLAQPSLVSTSTSSSSVVRSRTPAPAPPPPPIVQSTPTSVELGRLRQTLASAQVTVKDLTVELTEMRRAKRQLEEELESLSQALFEEANKMVADERKKVGALEEEARRARDERDALKARLSGPQGQEEDAANLSSSPTLMDSDGGLKHQEGSENSGDSTLATAASFPEADRHGFADTRPAPKKDPDPAEIEALMKRMEEDFGKL